MTQFLPWANFISITKVTEGLPANMDKYLEIIVSYCILELYFYKICEVNAKDKITYRIHQVSTQEI